MRQLIIFVIIFIVASLYFYQPGKPPNLPVEFPIFPKKEEEEPIPVVAVDIIDFPAVRPMEISLGKILADIESHMPAGHQYQDEDKITWAHETTHGINSVVRMKYHQQGKYNAFYILNSKAILVIEPPTTISKVRKNIPQSWQGKVWNLYMVSQAEQWDDLPLYIGDEWTAYINGTFCGHDLKITGIRYSCTMEYSCEFIGYALGLLYTVKQECPNYDDKQLQAWFKYNTERLLNLYREEDGAKQRMEILRTSADGEKLRQFARQSLGSAWCKKVMGL